MKRFLPRPTYANVVSTLCLFLLLGGGAALAASDLAKNSVGTKQIKNSAITTAKIKKGAVTGGKIKLATLGTVPSAATAGQLGGAPPSTYRDSCPNGTIGVTGGFCMTPQSIGIHDFFAAITACAQRGLQLPSPTEAWLIGQQPSVKKEFWSDDYWEAEPKPGEVVGEALVWFQAPLAKLLPGTTDSNSDTYCVALPTDQ